MWPIFQQLIVVTWLMTLVVQAPAVFISDFSPTTLEYDCSYDPEDGCLEEPVCNEVGYFAPYPFGINLGRQFWMCVIRLEMSRHLRTEKRHAVDRTEIDTRIPAGEEARRCLNKTSDQCNSTVYRLAYGQEPCLQLCVDRICVFRFLLRWNCLDCDLASQLYAGSLSVHLIIYAMKHAAVW